MTEVGLDAFANGRQDFAEGDDVRELAGVACPSPRGVIAVLSGPGRRGRSPGGVPSDRRRSARRPRPAGSPACESVEASPGRAPACHPHRRCDCAGLRQATKTGLELAGIMQPARRHSYPPPVGRFARAWCRPRSTGRSQETHERDRQVADTDFPCRGQPAAAAMVPSCAARQGCFDRRRNPADDREDSSHMGYRVRIFLRELPQSEGMYIAKGSCRFRPGRWTRSYSNIAAESTRGDRADRPQRLGIQTRSRSPPFMSWPSRRALTATNPACAMASTRRAAASLK